MEATNELLSPAEMDARYVKLLQNRQEEEEAKYFDHRNRFWRFDMNPGGPRGSVMQGHVNKPTEYEKMKRIKWGSLSRQILQPEDPRHEQPPMKKKTQSEIEEEFKTRSDVWLTHKVQSVTQGSLLAFLLFIIYLGVSLVIVYGVLEVGYNYYATTLSKIFTETPFNTSLGIFRTFNEIKTIEQLWDFITQVFLKVIYRTEGDTRSAVIDDAGVFWLFENILVGIPRIRQLRVQNGSCQVAVAVRPLFPSCYGYYDHALSDKEPFGLGQTAPWRYSEPNSGNAEYIGKISVYGGGGYMINITRDADKTKALIQELIQNKWIRKGARVIFIDFTTYTPNNNLFCVVKLVFELPPTGGVITTSHFYTMRFLRYVNIFDYIVIGAELAFLGFTGWYTFTAVIDLIFRRSYSVSMWYALDLIILAVSYVTIFIGYTRYELVEANMANYVEQIELGQHQSFDKLLEAQLRFNTGVAIISFLVWLKLLKYAILFKSMAVIYSAFGHIKSHVLTLTIVILTTILGFALVATMLFGTEVPQFTTLWNSIFSLVALFFGGLQYYPSCAEAHSRLAPLFFILYIFTVFILMVNTYVALVVYGFQKAAEVLKDQRERKYIWDIFNKIFYRTLRILCLRKKAARLKHKLETIENKKQYKSLVHIVKKHGFRGNALIVLLDKHKVYPGWPIPFSKMSDVYDDIDTKAQLLMEITEHDRLLSNVEKVSRKVEIIDEALTDMMWEVETLVQDFLETIDIKKGK